jgi:hypothetical protein
MGHSTGAGAIALWTHNLKSQDLRDWDDQFYKGKAIKMGAGVLARDAVSFSGAQKLLVLAGQCPSVGVAGGYIQGGGHSPLSSKYGLAADQALEYEVVDAKGNLLVANRANNTDLFWALSGGGGGSYGVVLSATVKAHPDIAITHGSLEFKADGLSADAFRDAVSAFHEFLPKLVDAGCATWHMFSRQGFNMPFLTAPGLSPDRVQELIAPFLATLDSMGAKYTKTFTEYPNWGAYYAVYSSVQTKGSAAPIHGGSWFHPRSNFVERPKGIDFVETTMKLQDEGATVIFLGLNASKAIAGNVDNAVFPGWRDVMLDQVIVL